MDARDRLVSAGLATVILPSGVAVRGRLPTTEDLYVRDLVPEDLLSIVGRFAMGATLKDIPEPDRPLWYRYLRLLVAAFIRAVRDEQGEWVPVSIRLEDTFTMDERDVDELEYIVLRLKTPDQVSALWRAEHGELTKEEALAIISAEAPKTMSGWATFRHLVAGLDPGQDGADVQPAAEPDARPNRAARRTRARRGTRVQAPSG